MIEAIISFLLEALEIDKSNIIRFSHMLLRAFILYFSSFLLIRFNKRFMGIRTPFNFILFVMLGSISAVSITEHAPFLPVLGIIFLLIFLNRTISFLEFRYPKFERLFKGEIVELVRDGEILWKNMKKNSITKRELLNELQSRLHTRDLSNISFAFLASDGEINFIKKKISQQ